MSAQIAVQLIVVAFDANVDALQLASALGLGPRRHGSKVRVEDLVRGGFAGAIEHRGQRIMFMPTPLTAAAAQALLSNNEGLVPLLWARLGETGPTDSEAVGSSPPSHSEGLRFDHGPDTLIAGREQVQAALEQVCGYPLAELLADEATELLEANYALDADPKARQAATPDPTGEARTMRAVLWALTLATVGAGLWFAFAR